MAWSCQACFLPHSDQGAARAARRLGIDYQCRHCSACTRPCQIIPTREERGREKKERKKRSTAQERAAAKRHGGRAVGGSGAHPLAKSDVRRRGVMRGECKYTDAASFSLKLSELQKLESEAAGDEAPVFEIQFDRTNPPRRYYVMPAWHYHQLTGDEE